MRMDHGSDRVIWDMVVDADPDLDLVLVLVVDSGVIMVEVDGDIIVVNRRRSI